MPEEFPAFFCNATDPVQETRDCVLGRLAQAMRAQEPDARLIQSRMIGETNMPSEQSAGYLPGDPRHGLQGEALKTKLTQDFDRFLRVRAALVVAAMKQLVEGQTPSLDALWKAVEVDGAAAVSGVAA